MIHQLYHTPCHSRTCPQDSYIFADDASDAGPQINLGEKGCRGP